MSERPTPDQVAWENLEDRIFNHQEILIFKKYGRDASDKANYGWGINEFEDRLEVETKIYGVGMEGGRDVLTTKGYLSGGELEDRWELDG